jgi:uncharacterized protein YjlB
MLRLDALVKSTPYTLRDPEVLTEHLRDDGRFPNNDTLPLVVYRAAVEAENLAAAFEELTRQNDWRGSWRNGVYSYHHYHSTAHEVLGVAAGTARLHLGGESGAIMNVEPGDVLVIPAGVAHKNLGSSDDFLVVGAYPAGQDWDMNYGRDGERPKADRNIAKVPLPAKDPIYGENGPLIRAWSILA